MTLNQFTARPSPLPTLFLLLTLLPGCGKKSEAIESGLVNSADTTTTVSEAVDDEDTATSTLPNNVVQFEGTQENDVRKALEVFAPFTPVTTLCQAYIDKSDSIKWARDTEELKEPKDTVFLRPYKQLAYEAIIRYKKALSKYENPGDDCPGLLQLTREPLPSDSSSAYLPHIAHDGVLGNVDFFFLGGAPYISQVEPTDNQPFKDEDGKHELRYATSITENANFLFNSLFHNNVGSLTVTYGPPLSSYDSGPHDVYGIGTLIHHLNRRFPAYFITNEGLINAHLISVELKIIPENLGCVSDQPLFEFASKTFVDVNDILGIYIPYDNYLPPSCKISRPSSFTWTADFNGDGVPDLACVSGTLEGISADTITNLLWYVNISGKWKVIDWGRQLDCT